MNPQMAVQQMQADMTDLLMQRFMTLTPQQMQAIKAQMGGQQSQPQGQPQGPGVLAQQGA